MIDYSQLPEHLRAEAREYVEQGIPPCAFTRAVLENNLFRAARLADSRNKPLLSEIARWWFWEADGLCCGSKEIVRAWLDSRSQSTRQSTSTRRAEGAHQCRLNDPSRRRGK